MGGHRWETKEIEIGLDLKVTVPYLSTVPGRASGGANYLIKQRLDMEARNNWVPVGPTDFKTLWKNKQVKYTQRGTPIGGVWHLDSATITLQRMVL